VSVTFLSDALVEGAPPVSLAAHAPTIGLPLWTVPGGFTSHWTINPSGEAWCDTADGGGSGNPIFGANASLSPNVNISSDFKYFDGNCNPGLCIHMSADGLNGYVAYDAIGGFNVWRAYEVTAGVIGVVLLSFNMGAADCNVGLDYTGATLSLYKNGVSVASVGDVTHPAAGYAGLFNFSLADTISTGQHWKNVLGVYTTTIGGPDHYYRMMRGE